VLIGAFKLNLDRLPDNTKASCLGMSWDPGQLRCEASALHRAVFGRDTPAEVAGRYADAHQMALSRIDASQSAWMRRVVDEKSDVEALEIVLRSRQPDHVLCHKIRLLIYIAEAYPEYYHDLINEESCRAQALLSLTLHSLRTVWKYVKGRWLLWRMA